MQINPRTKFIDMGRQVLKFLPKPMAKQVRRIGLRGMILGRTRDTQIIQSKPVDNI
jgi:hypothetical protein